MGERNFREMLEEQWARGNFVSVGLDSDYEKIPSIVRKRAINEVDAMFIFNTFIIDATKDVACAYKLNSAFYEACGDAGWGALRKTIEYIHTRALGVPVILDAKRGDIGNTSAQYARAAFNHLCADAITLSPYLGSEALKPFLEYKNKGIFVLCRTSNPGSGEFQNVLVGGEPMYCFVARRVAHHWNKHGNCALVVGATFPEELQTVRSIAPDIPILIPGVGEQGGDAEQAVSAGKDSRRQGVVVNSSRGIIFASNGADFAEAARRETIKLRDAINRYR